jgi:hypothetical protein
MDLIFRKFRSQKPEVSLRKTRSFGSKNPKFRFEKHEVSVPVRKTEVSVRKPKVSGSFLPECFGSGNPEILNYCVPIFGYHLKTFTVILRSSKMVEFHLETVINALPSIMAEIRPMTGISELQFE